MIHCIYLFHLWSFILLVAAEFDCGNLDQFDRKLDTSFIYHSTDGDDYLTATKQWTYLTNQDKISPSIIIYPQTDNDIFVATDFARECNYKIVVRSGGHQYSALSSCNSKDDNCIQLDMKYYNKIDFISNSDSNSASLLSVEPGVQLKQFFEYLDKHNSFLPGGEHLGIGIGGHVLTGGDGVLTKAFGLLGDYVKSFDIILSNATKLEGVMYNSDDDDIYGDLYKSVLGGPPGSYGIITKYNFELKNEQIRNDNNCYPNSIGFRYLFKYSKQLWKRILQIFMDIHNDKKYYLENDNIGSIMLTISYDVHVTDYVINLKWVWVGKPITTELCAIGDISGSNRNMHDADGYYISRLLLNAAKELNIEPFDKQEVKLPISKLMMKFSENYGEIAILPYELRSYYIIRNIEDDLINVLTNEIDSYITQFGHFRSSGTIFLLLLESFVQAEMYRKDPFNIKTSYPYRNEFIGIPCLVFYNNSIRVENANIGNYEDYKSGNNNNIDMKTIVKRKLDSMVESMMNTKAFDFGNEDLRHLSLTFGDVDINNVWMYYYPNQTLFEELKAVKLKYDPIDMFHTAFTVPLPQMKEETKMEL